MIIETDERNLGRPASVFNNWPMPVRIAIAIAILAVCLAIRFLILPVEAGLAYLTFYPGTAVAALFCGFLPTMIYIVLATIVGTYIFLPPYWSFDIASVIPVFAYFISATTILLAFQFYQWQASIKSQQSPGKTKKSAWTTLSLLLAALLGITCFNLYKAYGTLGRQERGRLELQSDTLRSNLSRRLQTTSNAIDAIRREYQAGFKGTKGRRLTASRLSEAVSTIDGVRTFVIVDSGANIVASSRTELLGMNFGDTERFKYLSSKSDGNTLYIVHPFKTPLNVFTVALAKVMVNGRGQFDGYVMAVLDPEYFRQLADNVANSANTEITVVHGDGPVVFASSRDGKLLGTDFSKNKNSLLARYLGSGKSVAEFDEVSDVAHQHSLSVVQAVSPESSRADKPLVLAVSRDAYAYYGPWKIQAEIQLGAWAVVSVLSVAGLTYYQRRQRILVELEAMRRETEQSLRRSERLASVADDAIRLKLATEAADLGIWNWTYSTNQIEWDEQMWEIYGASVAERSPATQYEFWRSHVHPEDLPEVEAVLSRAVSTNTPYVHSFRIVRSDGQVRFIEANSAVRFDEDGQAIGMVGVNRDVTERMELEDNLREAKRVADSASQAKSHFLANMSHEIRTPLNAVIGMGYLLEKTRLDEDQHIQLHTIQVASRNLLALINDILDVSKIEAGELQLNSEPFALRDLLEEIKALLEPAAAAKGLLLTIEAPGAAFPAVLKGDEGRLRQMLINLANNAIKFTDAGSVSLTTEFLDDCPDAGFVNLRFSVKDTGIGIPPEQHGRLFSPFSQADASISRKFGGTGLGLSIVRLISEQMGGCAGFESAQGKGSTFWIEVPLAISDQILEKISLGTKTRPLHVIVADDAAEDREYLSSLVRQFGWQVVGVADGKALVEMVMDASRRGQPVDCIVVDWRMPEMDGVTALRTLRSQFAGNRFPSVIMITAGDVQTLRQTKGAELADSVLTKPINASSLFNCVNAAVMAHGHDFDHVLNASAFDSTHTQWLSGVRTLVVDDSATNLEVCRRILEHEGAIATLCGSGEEALTRLADPEHAFDVVLMDVQMPGLDGLQTTMRIRSELANEILPVVALTAGAMTEDRHRAKAAGMNDFLTKPIVPVQLIRVIRQCIQASRAAPLPVSERRAPVDASTDFPVIPGIDTGQAFSRLHGDREFFLELLKHFYEEYRGAARMLETFISGSENASAANYLHRMLGQAGNIAANELIEQLRALEAALVKGEGNFSRELGNANAKLSDFLAAISPWASHVPGPAPDGHGLASRSELQADISELKDLLARNLLSAQDRSQAVASKIAGTAGFDAYRPVADAIGRLKFKEALEALERFDESLPL